MQAWRVRLDRHRSAGRNRTKSRTPRFLHTWVQESARRRRTRPRTGRPSMRRIIHALAATVVVATGTFSVAQAKQVVPMHTQDVTKTVTQGFRSIAVSADYATITLRPG